MCSIPFALSVLSAASVLLGAAAEERPESPYGVCAHVTRGEPQVAEFRLMRAAGIAWARSDFDWSGVQHKADGPWTFAALDTVISNAEANGVQMLPILGYNTAFATPSYAHLDLWTNYVHALAARYGRRLPVLELWNEENISGFWKDPDPTNYAALLRATYETVKSVDPALTLAVGGFSGVPTNFIERLYQAGGGRFFDVMNVHPYGQPRDPESYLEAQLTGLRAVMAKYGDADKPLWITEIGWPTQKQRMAAPGLIRAGLKAARPDKRDAWRIGVIDDPDFSSDFSSPSDVLLDAECPENAHVQRLSIDALYAAADANAVDAVVLPFNENFPADGFDHLIDFVCKGGILIECGGMPLWNPRMRKADGTWGKSSKYGEAFRTPLRIGVEAWWDDKNRIPEKMPVRYTGPAADLPQPKETVVAERFLKPLAFKPGDRFIPLLAGEHNGYTGTAAAVYSFNSDFKGAVIVSALFERGQQGSSEVRQAKLLPRALLIARRLGTARTFWYEFQAPEADDLDPESHFGIVHRDLSPKPAYAAYRTLAAQCPAGSVDLDRPWKSEDGTLYFPQWKRPDGQTAGAVWAFRGLGAYRLTFAEKGVVLTSHTGEPIEAEWNGASCVLPLADAPVYFVGAALESALAVSPDAR